MLRFTPRLLRRPPPSRLPPPPRLTPPLRLPRAEAAPAPAAPAAASDAPIPNQYSLGHLWEEGDWISKAILICLAIMSAGTWYIFFTKWLDQQRILSQAQVVEKKFWTSATLNEGVDKLPKNSVFRGIAEAGLKASTGGTTLVGMSDWIGMTLTRQLEDANARLQGGIAFLGSVGSVSPFVGLLGTVMGILNALISIGVSGQASIDQRCRSGRRSADHDRPGSGRRGSGRVALQLPDPPQQDDHREAARLCGRPAGLPDQQEQVSAHR